MDIPTSLSTHEQRTCSIDTAEAKALTFLKYTISTYTFKKVYTAIHAEQNTIIATLSFCKNLPAKGQIQESEFKSEHKVILCCISQQKS